MVGTKVELNGYNYLVIHLGTDLFYGKKSVYHVLTNNQKWCGNIIPDLCGYPKAESKGVHDVRYKREPTITNALRPYYTVDFVEDNLYQLLLDCESLKKKFDVDTDSYYVFTYIEPYDD